MTRKAVETLIGVNQVLGGVLILTAQASAVRQGFGVASRMFSWRFELGLKVTVELTSH